MYKQWRSLTFCRRFTLSGIIRWQIKGISLHLTDEELGFIVILGRPIVRGRSHPEWVCPFVIESVVTKLGESRSRSVLPSYVFFRRPLESDPVGSGLSEEENIKQWTVTSIQPSLQDGLFILGLDENEMGRMHLTILGGLGPGALVWRDVVTRLVPWSSKRKRTAWWVVCFMKSKQQQKKEEKK